MHLRFYAQRLLLAAAVAGAASCSHSTAPDSPQTRNPGDVRFLAVLAGAPPLATTRAQFWAVKGRNSGVDLWYHAPVGRSDSTRFLEFRLGGASLERRPDGTLIAQGDSVLITVTVTDATHLVVDFQPSGLVFSANDRPKLKLSFGECGDDLNGDGKVDADDDALEQQLSMWRQELPGQPWLKLASVNLKSSREIEAELGGFTGYALMY